MKKKYLIPEINIETIVTTTSILIGSPNTENPGGGVVIEEDDHGFGN